MMAERAEQFRALFDPKGVIVAGASTHPGKFGFVVLHNMITSGYQGSIFATNRDGAEVLGRATLRSIEEVPAGSADLLFVCTPASTNVELLTAAAAKGVRAAFIASAGYGEADSEGQKRQDELVALADRLGMLIVGPNGQGLVSTPSSLCAQIVAPYPPAGHIGIASQSGNFVSSFMNLATQSGVGVSRAVSVGNAAQVGVLDALEYFAEDPHTSVALLYVEGIPDGRAFAERVGAVARRMPVVLLKGGTTASGARAAASHTGSLATDDKVFDGMCAQYGIVRAASLTEAFDCAATLATQPFPPGARTAVVTTVGGWGVVTADALSGTGLELTALPSDLRDTLDDLLPPRWSRNNPIDMAGGETKDTVPDVLRAVVGHRDIDAVIMLGVGIQSNQGALERNGPFYPDHGLERIVAFHDRQDRRYIETAVAVSEEFAKPVFVATELAVADPQNAAVVAMRESGRFCFPSAERAVVALDRIHWLASWRARRGLQQFEF